MASATGYPSPTGMDSEKLAALRRTKAIATLALCLCVAVFATAKLQEAHWPWLSYVAAFAEAAVIGGIADWYAVVALFRRPLGLPIPHTAIIPANQHRIADNLGRFIEVNFLAPGPVREKLKEVDFAALVADWLSGPERAAGLSRFVARLVPQTLSAIERVGPAATSSSSACWSEVEKVKVAPLAADLLSAFTDDRRHQTLFDEFTKVVGRFLSDEQALATMREQDPRGTAVAVQPVPRRRLSAEEDRRLGRLAARGGEGRSRPSDAPGVRSFRRSSSSNGCATSKAYDKRAEELKRDLLARPELADFADDLWRSMRAFIEQDVDAENSLVRRHLASMFVDVGRHLATDPAIRADMNEGFVVALASFVESQKSGVSTFIADQVKRWDLGAADPADRDQHRPRPAIYPLQRHADRRTGRAGAACVRADFPGVLTGRRSVDRRWRSWSRRRVRRDRQAECRDKD